jgi:hypothetical protein
MTDQLNDIIEQDGKFAYVRPFISPLDSKTLLRAAGASETAISLNPVSSALLRNYIAHWLIEDGQLYLKGIYMCQKREHYSLQTLFNQGKLLKAEWYSGELNISSEFNVVLGAQYGLKSVEPEYKITPLVVPKISPKRWLVEQGNIVERAHGEWPDTTIGISHIRYLPSDVQQLFPEVLRQENLRQKWALVNKLERKKREQEQQYDIIGDIHGHADALTGLLRQLGYLTKEGVWQAPLNRKVIFLGDYIDRGPQQKQVLSIVQAMIAKGYALAIMGNHEFNALAYHTKVQAKKGTPRYFLRAHSDNNQRQHAAFLDAYSGDSVGLKAALNFFKTLPLWLDLPNIRAVHACWHPQHMVALQPTVTPGSLYKLNRKSLVNASSFGTAEFDAVEVLLKGVEVPLASEEYFFKDKEGRTRKQVRVEWWHNDNQVLADVAMPRDTFANSSWAQDYCVERQFLPGYDPLDKPLFVGHYWMKSSQCEPLTKNIACLDYSIANGGMLAAYRWQGEKELTRDNFVAVDENGRLVS